MKKVAVTAVAVLGIAVAGCSASGEVQSVENSSPEPTVSQTAETPSPSPTPTETHNAHTSAPSTPVKDSPTETHKSAEKTHSTPQQHKGSHHKTFKLGQKAVYTIKGQKAATITVSNLKVINDKLSQYGDPPEHHYLKFLVSVHAYKGLNNVEFGKPVYNVNPFNWKVKDKSGFTYDPAFVMGVDHILDAVSLHPGQKVKGYVVFDAPKHGLVELTIGLSNTADWKF